jgi:hypothetical protein
VHEGLSTPGILGNRPSYSLSFSPGLLFTNLNIARSLLNQPEYGSPVLVKATEWMRCLWMENLPVKK